MKKLGTDPTHAQFVQRQLDEHPYLNLDELCMLVEKQFDLRVSTATMCRFLKQMSLSRKRKGKQMPLGSLNEYNAQMQRVCGVSLIRKILNETITVENVCAFINILLELQRHIY